MNTWHNDYVTDVGYTAGYYPHLNPLKASLPLLAGKVVPPRVDRACELGFGQGLTINIHAAASPVSWSGTDYNSAHVSFARQLGEAAGSGINLYEDSFADFVRRELPEFDYLAIHGIWSWISAENKNFILDFIYRKLKPGGIVCISYNVQPGWAAMSPVRELMLAYSRRMQPGGTDSLHKMDNALQFLTDFIAAKPAYFNTNPGLVKEFDGLSKKDTTYLVHEYLNDNWTPETFVQIAGQLQKAKLSYVCSASELDNLDHIILSAEQKKFIDGIPDAIFRETMKDFCINSRFRKDYWIKGAAVISEREKLEHLRSLRFILKHPADQVPMKFSTPRGKVNLAEKIYKPLLESLADFQIKSFALLEQELQGRGVSSGQLLEAMLVMSSRGFIEPVQNDLDIQQAEKTSASLNNFLLNRAKNMAELPYLASCVTGGGVKVNHLEQLFILSRRENCQSAAQSADFAWSVLKSDGRKLVKAGKVLKTEQENKEMLEGMAKEFYQTTLYKLKALKIC